MKNYKFGTRSRKNLKNVHPNLVLIAEKALEMSPIDFGVSCGHRTLKAQKKMYQQGRSNDGAIITNCDGVKRKSKHNEFPSLAIDIFAHIPDDKSKAFDMKTLCVIAGCFYSAAEMLKDAGQIDHELVWGGNWDGDDQIAYDQRLVDMPHFEIKKNK